MAESTENGNSEEIKAKEELSGYPKNPKGRLHILPPIEQKHDSKVEESTPPIRPPVATAKRKRIVLGPFTEKEVETQKKFEGLLEARLAGFEDEE